RAPRERRTPGKRESARIEKLEARMQAIGEELDAALDSDDEETADALQEEGDSLAAQLQDLEERLLDYNHTIKAAAGAVVTIDWQGQGVRQRGLMREAEAKALRTLEHLQRGLTEQEANGRDSVNDRQQQAASRC